MSYPAFRVRMSVDGGTPEITVVTTWQNAIDRFFAKAVVDHAAKFEIELVNVDIVP
jgi:hypothetical protein